MPGRLRPPVGPSRRPRRRPSRLRRGAEPARQPAPERTTSRVRTVGSTAPAWGGISRYACRRSQRATTISSPSTSRGANLRRTPRSVASSEFGGSKGGYRTAASLQTGRQGGTRASRRVRSTQRSRRMQRMRTLLQRPRPPLALLQLRLHERAAGLGTSATIPAGVFAVAARPRPRHRESRHPPLQQALSAGMA